MQSHCFICLCDRFIQKNNDKYLGIGLTQYEKVVDDSLQVNSSSTGSQTVL
jgi:hypothetical protein